MVDPQFSRPSRTCQPCEARNTRHAIETSHTLQDGVARGLERMCGGWLPAAACWLPAATLVGLLAAAACPGGACRVPGLEHDILAALHAARRPWLDALLVPASWLGSIAVLLPAAFALWLWRRHRAAARVALFPLLAVGGAWLFVHSAKLLVARPRPDLFAPLVAMPQDLSFPSAHAAQAGAFAIAVVLISSRQRAWSVIAAASLLVATVALSRLYLQVHYPSDVLAGLIVGAGWTAGLWLLLGRTR